MIVNQLPVANLVKIASSRAEADADSVERVLTLALGLVERHAAPEATARLYEAVPGAEAMARSAEAGPRKGGGLFSGVLRGAAGLSGPAIAEAMGAAETLKRENGIDRDALTRILKAARRAVEFKTGHDFVGEALKTIPGVSKLLGG